MKARREGLLAAALAAALHGGAALVGILTGLEGTSEWYDQAHYHLPVIERFAAELPSPTLSDYQSATTPGYHLVLAAALWVGAGPLGLHLFNAMFGVALIGALAYCIGRLSGWKSGVAAGALLGLSPYTLSGSIWLNTDNLGLLLVACALFVALPIAGGASKGVGTMVGRSAALAAIGVMVRQILAYAAAIPLAALVARSIGERRWPSRRDCALGVAALAPAVLVVACFAWLWQGLVPPSFRGYHGAGANPVTPIYALALIGVWGTLVFSGIRGFPTELLSRRMLLLGLVAGGLSMLVETDYVQDVRWGGVLWTLAKAMPAPGGRSVVIVPLAALGAASLGAFIRIAVSRRDAATGGAPFLPMFVLAAAIAAQTANQQCFERYLQPSVVLMCAVSAALLGGRSLRPWRMAFGAGSSALLSITNVFAAAEVSR